MKLIKPDNSDYWHVEVTCADGTQRLVNLSLKHKDAARQAMLDAHLPEIREAAKHNLLTAKAVITAKWAITVDEAIADWAEWSKVGVPSPKTRQNTWECVCQWSEQMGIGDRPLLMLKASDIGEWINDPTSVAKASTRKLKLSCIQAFVRYCLQKQYIVSEPSRLVKVDEKMMDTTQRETKRKMVFTDDQIECLLAKSVNSEPPSITPGFFHAGIIFGRDLGLRLSDLCCLEWACFNYKKNTVSILMEKSQKRVEIPLTPRVRGEIAGMEKAHDRFLFPTEREMVLNMRRRAALSIYFVRFFQRCGFEGYSFQSLCAIYAASMAAKGATLEEIAIALRHKTSIPSRG